MTKQQLIKNATTKNFTIEFSKDKYSNDLIGINKGKWNYHWFIIYNIDNDEKVLFSHSYSQLTGKVKKGIRLGVNIQESLGFYNN